jgi:methylated-DNA-[protein]-cysteine S-methyltransferase
MVHLGRGTVTVKTSAGTLRVDVRAAGIAPAKLVRQLKLYLSGKPVKFRGRYDLSFGTPFQRKVWRAMLAIPRGQTRSYAWIAKRIGHPQAVRAVGAACGANRAPIVIPCHRVIAGDGSLGGFSGGLGLKKRLLKLEGVSL